MALHVAGMALLGFASLAVFVAAQQWRIRAQTRMPSVENAAAQGSTAPPAPLEALAAGIDASLAAAVARLARRRSPAVSALDAAKRAAAAGGLGFRYVHAFVLQARRDLQNGDPARARAMIEEARAALREVDAQGHGPQARLERYAGATLIDARGERIGEIAAVAPRAGTPSVQLSLGGVHDAAGLVDFGARRLWLPAEMLIFGRPNLIGPTLVVWTGAPPGARAAGASR